MCAKVEYISKDWYCAILALTWLQIYLLYYSTNRIQLDGFVESALVLQPLSESPLCSRPTLYPWWRCHYHLWCQGEKQNQWYLMAMCKDLGVRQGGSVVAKILTAWLSLKTMLMVEIQSPYVRLNLLQISESKDWRCTWLLMPVLSAMYFDSLLDSAIRNWRDYFQSNWNPAKVRRKLVLDSTPFTWSGSFRFQDLAKSSTCRSMAKLFRSGLRMMT